MHFHKPFLSSFQENIQKLQQWVSQVVSHSRGQIFCQDCRYLLWSSKSVWYPSSTSFCQIWFYPSICISSILFLCTYFLFLNFFLYLLRHLMKNLQILVTSTSHFLYQLYTTLCPCSSHFPSPTIRGPHLLCLYFLQSFIFAESSVSIWKS